MFIFTQTKPFGERQLGIPPEDSGLLDYSKLEASTWQYLSSFHRDNVHKRLKGYTKSDTK